MVLVHAVDNVFRVGCRTVGIQLVFKAAKSQKMSKILQFPWIWGARGEMCPLNSKILKDMLILVYLFFTPLVDIDF